MKKKRKMKKVKKSELKKVKGGVDLYEEFNSKVLGKNMNNPGADAVLEVGSKGVSVGLKIKWS